MPAPKKRISQSLIIFNAGEGEARVVIEKKFHFCCGCCYAQWSISRYDEVSSAEGMINCPMCSKKLVVSFEPPKKKRDDIE
jgi:predicted SprT family Zn-dependent metalloprotease